MTESIYGLYISGFTTDSTSVSSIVSKLNNKTNTFGESFSGLINMFYSNSITVYKNELYVGGHFFVDSIKYQYVSKLNNKTNTFGDNFSGLKGGSSSLSIINAMTVYKNELYVGGSYYDGSKYNQYVSKLNNKTNTFGENFSGLKSGSNSQFHIKAMTVYKNELYVGGSYYDGSKYNQYVSKLNNKTNTFGENFSGLKGGSEYSNGQAMTVYKDELYVGGYYGDDSIYYQYVSKLNNKTNTFGENFSGLNESTFDSIIYAMTVYKNELYVGGTYSDGSNTSATFIKLNNKTNTFGENFSGLKESRIIHTMTVYKDELYVGGSADDYSNKQYVSKLNNKTNTFGDNFSGLESSDEGISRINAMISFEPEEEDDNIGLILGLVLGLGLGLPLLVYFYLKMKR